MATKAQKYLWGLVQDGYKKMVVEVEANRLSINTEDLIRLKVCIEDILIRPENKKNQSSTAIEIVSPHLVSAQSQPVALNQALARDQTASSEASNASPAKLDRSMSSLHFLANFATGIQTDREPFPSHVKFEPIPISQGSSLQSESAPLFEASMNTLSTLSSEGAIEPAEVTGAAGDQPHKASSSGSSNRRGRKRPGPFSSTENEIILEAYRAMKRDNRPQAEVIQETADRLNRTYHGMRLRFQELAAEEITQGSVGQSPRVEPPAAAPAMSAVSAVPAVSALAAAPAMSAVGPVVSVVPPEQARKLPRQLEKQLEKQRLHERAVQIHEKILQKQMLELQQQYEQQGEDPTPGQIRKLQKLQHQQQLAVQLQQQFVQQHQQQQYQYQRQLQEQMQRALYDQTPQRSLRAVDQVARAGPSGSSSAGAGAGGSAVATATHAAAAATAAANATAAGVTARPGTAAPAAYAIPPAERGKRKHT